MTNATTETTKLNFITDQGSTRAMVRCACRADRFDFAFCALLEAEAVTWPAAVWPGLADEAAIVGAAGVLGAAGRLPVVPARRKVRAGDDRELGGGSGISHAKAAGETDGGSADAGGVLDGGRPDSDDGRPGGMVPEGAVGDGSPSGLAAYSAGSAAVRSSAASRTGGDGGRPKLNAGESPARD
jgi:hypothetical protein